MRHHLLLPTKKISARFVFNATISILVGLGPFLTVANDDLEMDVFAPESAPAPPVAAPSQHADRKLIVPDIDSVTCQRRPSQGGSDSVTLRELIERLQSEGTISVRPALGRRDRVAAAAAAPAPQRRDTSGGRARRPSASREVSDGLMRATRMAVQQVTPPLKKVYKKKGSVGRNGYRRSSFHCAAYVRVALEKANMIRRGGLHSSGQAKYYGCGLKNNGFSNLCGSRCEGPRAATCRITPAQAPMGSVLVYDDTGCAHPAGHMEIKTPQGYVSDYLSRSARTGNNRTRGNCRRLVGIWVK